ncbi:MAG: tRNA epoxyqueuosine(34) reductase QueG [Gemmatimonadetes bacterium]|nr:MAG: tRNA epoxyqueuosine(34) reductase QueG [Gemmatimonadota bacterium]
MLRSRVHEAAHEVGFALCGVARPDPSDHLEHYRAWLAAGYHGDMAYLARPDAVARRGDPARTLAEVRAIVVVGDLYDQPDPPGVPDDPSRGVIARYARGRDYHRVMRTKLRRLAERIERAAGGEGLAGVARAYVDTGPVLERELARRAGLGWFGRNTMLIHPRAGSYFFLGVLFTTVEIEPDAPFEADHCGTCRRCVDACPTGALLDRDPEGAPVLDATRCISYLTIEQRGPIPQELRPALGNRVFGCDICQEVCPWNVRFSRPAEEPAYRARGPGELPQGVEVEGGRPGGARPTKDSGAASPPHPGTDFPGLVELLETALDPGRWDAFTRGSPIRRAGRVGLARSACVALGNELARVRTPRSEALAVLRRAAHDSDPVVAEAAGWALKRAGGRSEG